MELPGALGGDWNPIGSQFLNPSSSTALTLPALPTGQRGYTELAAVALCQSGGIWVRFDGQAVTTFVNGGLRMVPGDSFVLRSRNQISGVRVIKDVTMGGWLAITYYSVRALGL
jgi:hypothetical protein